MSKKEVVVLRDFFVLILLFSAILFFSVTLHSVLYGKRQTQETAEITLTVEDLPYELLSGVSVGDRVLDRTRRVILGNIVELSTVPHTYESAVGGESVSVTKEGYCDATLRIRIDREIGRNRDVGAFYIGSSMSISTPNYAGEGKITAVRREEIAS